MQSLEQKKSWRYANLSADSIIFFICFYLYVWLFIEPHLIYHSFGNFIAYPNFSVDWTFLKAHLGYPGGLAAYIGGFLSQLYYFSWLGALVATAVAWLIYTAAKILIQPLVKMRFKFICFIPAVMLLMIHNRYDIQLTSFLTLSVVLWFSVLYEKVPVRNSPARIAVFLGMFALLYYIVGGTSFVFALLAMAYELFAGRRKVLSMLFPAVAIGTYLIGKYIFDLQIEIIHLQLSEVLFERDPWIKGVVICIYFFFPTVLFALGLWQELVSKKVSTSKPEIIDKIKYLKMGSLRQLFQSKKAKWIIETALALFILTAGIFISFNSTKKKLLQIDYLAHKRMWSDVLAIARQIRPQSFDTFCIHDINRALFYIGRLGDEMFRYPQEFNALILSRSEFQKPNGRIFLKRSRLFLELGHVGIAERDAFEYLELVGSTPRIIEQLATIKLVKGQTEAAKVFLRALSKDLIFGNQGSQILRRLERDPALTGDKWIQYIRSVASEKESASFTITADEFFLQLLKKNKRNRLAFEYMMACYLLNGQVDKLVTNLGLLKNFGYKRLPRYYEEAIVIYMGSGLPEMNLHGFQPRQETMQRAQEVNRVFTLNGGRKNEKAIRAKLGSSFADSYFLYFIFETPRTRQ
jgi:hypothetical protein